jgi:hypothetical protein
MPKVWLPTLRFTMMKFLGSDEVPSSIFVELLQVHQRQQLVARRRKESCVLDAFDLGARSWRADQLDHGTAAGSQRSRRGFQ